MKQFKEGTDELVDIPNVKASSGRAILTPENYIEFYPDQVWNEFHRIARTSGREEKTHGFSQTPRSRGEA